MVTNHVQSQILMRESDVTAFGGWLKSGNYDEEAQEAEIKCCKGQSFSFGDFAMEAWNKYQAEC